MQSTTQCVPAVHLAAAAPGEDASTALTAAAVRWKYPVPELEHAQQCLP